MKPAWAIKANGKDVTASFRPYLMSISVRDTSRDEADTLTIVLDNSKRLLDAPRQGDELEPLIGYEDNLTAMGRFVVDEATFQGPPDTMTITCKSAFFVNSAENSALRSFKTQRDFSWQPTTLLTICSTIAARNGVDLVTEPGIGLSVKVTPHLDQVSESDASFLWSLLRIRGYTMKIADRKLIIGVRSSGSEVNYLTGEAVKPIVLKPGDVSAYSGKWVERLVYDKIVATWHDPSTGLLMSHTEGTGDRVFRIKYPMSDEATAIATAKAMLRERQSGGGSVTITMPGRTDIQAERAVTFEEFPYPLSKTPTKSAIAKEWIVKSVDHAVSSSGYITSFQGEPFVPPA